MNYEKIITREDKSKVLIALSMFMDSYGSRKLSFYVSVATKQPKKRKWNYIDFSNNYTWRALSISERRKHNLMEYLKVVTREEIYEAKLEAWESLKPVFGEEEL